jgi:hypothetical protein
MGAEDHHATSRSYAGLFPPQPFNPAECLRDVIASSKGYWPKLLSEGANANATVNERDSDMGGGAAFTTTAWRSRSAQGPFSRIANHCMQPNFGSLTLFHILKTHVASPVS